MSWKETLRKWTVGTPDTVWMWRMAVILALGIAGIAWMRHLDII